MQSNSTQAKEQPVSHIEALVAQAVKAGKTVPKKGKALKILHELIEADSGGVSEARLIIASGTDFIENALASLHDMGWIIATSPRFTRDRNGRQIRKTVYFLNRENNGINTDTNQYGKESV